MGLRGWLLGEVLLILGLGHVMTLSRGSGLRFFFRDWRGDGLLVVVVRCPSMRMWIPEEGSGPSFSGVGVDAVFRRVCGPGWGGEVEGYPGADEDYAEEILLQGDGRDFEGAGRVGVRDVGEERER